jgi:hypothetical protein
LPDLKERNDQNSSVLNDRGAPLPGEAGSLAQRRGYGRRGGRNDAARAEILLGAVAAIAGAAVLVYANRPEVQHEPWGERLRVRHESRGERGALGRARGSAGRRIDVEMNTPFELFYASCLQGTDDHRFRRTMTFMGASKGDRRATP